MILIPDPSNYSFAALTLEMSRREGQPPKASSTENTAIRTYLFKDKRKKEADAREAKEET